MLYQRPLIDDFSTFHTQMRQASTRAFLYTHGCLKMRFLAAHNHNDICSEVANIYTRGNQFHLVICFVKMLCHFSEITEGFFFFFGTCWIHELNTCLTALDFADSVQLNFSFNTYENSSKIRTKTDEIRSGVLLMTEIYLQVFPSFF